ncbi:MAG: VOC family protein [Myxococcales bacterium]
MSNDKAAGAGTNAPRFVWYDLMTTDEGGAKAFYSKVLGWGTQAWEGSSQPYTMWTVKSTPIGGLMRLPPEAASAGAPPHWLGYVGCKDVDASTKQAEKLGGKLLHPPMDIPEVGRFSVLADPQGAVFALFTPKAGSSMESPAPGTPGNVSWAELNTTDWEGAWKFYAALCDWKPTTAMDMEGLGTYFMFTHRDGGDKSMGGMSNAATMMKAPAHWMFYVDVADIDKTLAIVKESGGKVLNGPMDVPGNGKIAQCMDPQGAFFAVYYQG